MAKRSLSFTGLTPTAFADSVAITDSTYLGVIKGGSSTQRINIIEVYLGGQAASTSSPTLMVLSRDDSAATGSATLSAGGTDAALDGATAALAAAPVVGNLFATTKPFRSAVSHLLNLSFNAYGGVVRWLAAPGEEITIVGNASGVGECSLSAFTGGTPGAIGSHIIYEPL